MDDVLVFGKNQKEHDEYLTEALERVKEAGLTLTRRNVSSPRNKSHSFGKL